MNKLVSKNPILRFKLGKKIVKAEEGAVARWQRRIRHPFLSYLNLDRKLDINRMDPFRYLENKISKIGSWIGNNLVVENHTPENGGTINNKLRNQQLNNNLNIANKQNTYKTPELRGSKEAYLNRLQQQGFTAKPTNKVNITQTLKSLLKPLSKLLNNIWIKGYNRHPEITDVRAMLQKLWDLGLLKGSKFGVDGKWGSDTENAYKKYLLNKENPVVAPVLTEIPLIAPLLTQTTLNQAPKTLTNFTPLRTGTFNKSQIRNLISEKLGQNAYNYTGAQRRALRQYLNGESDDTSLLTGDLSKFIISNKQGGQLVSRNPIVRFKNKKK